MKILKEPTVPHQTCKKCGCVFEVKMSFIQFVKMFDFTSADYVKELIARIEEIFQLVLDSAAEKN